MTSPQLPPMIVCGPPGVATVITGACGICQGDTRQVEAFCGYMYGYDRHCLTCRHTGAEGWLDPEFSTPARDEKELAYWDRYAANPVPKDLYDAAIAAEYAAYEHGLDEAEEKRRDARWNETRQQVRKHWAVADTRVAS